MFKAITNSTVDFDETLGLSSSEQDFMLFYNLMVIVLGVSGNSIVLYGSRIHHAIQMDRVSLMFLENLALSDIAIALLYFVPMLITLFVKRWVFGKALCFISAFFFTNIPYSNEIFITVSLSCYRLWILTKPRAMRANIKTSYVRILMVFILLITLIPWIIFISLDCYAYFTAYNLNCVPSIYDDNRLTVLTTILYCIYIGIPVVVLIITNLIILYTVSISSRRAGRNANINTNTVVTIACVCSVFTLSHIPSVIISITNTLGIHKPIWCNILDLYSPSLNTVANPIVYTIKNKRFRCFIKSMFTRNNIGENKDQQ